MGYKNHATWRNKNACISANMPTEYEDMQRQKLTRIELFLTVGAGEMGVRTGEKGK